MAYDSVVTGEVIPSNGDLEALVGFLRERGFQTRPWRCLTLTGDELLDPEGQSTGLFVNRRSGAVEGIDQGQGCYGFGRVLIEALQVATEAGLVESGRLIREGERSDDVEEYALQDGQWRQWVAAGAYAPLYAADEMREAFGAAVVGVLTL